MTAPLQAWCTLQVIRCWAIARGFVDLAIAVGWLQVEIGWVLLDMQRAEMS